MKKSKYLKTDNIILDYDSDRQYVVYLPADDQFTILHYNYLQIIITSKTFKDLHFRKFKYGWEFPDGSTLGLKRMPKWKKIYAEIVAEL